ISLYFGEGQVQFSQAQEEIIRHSWGLDKPWPEQYVDWAGNMLTGNFGESIIRQGVPVSTIIFEAAGVTILLNLLSVLISLGLAIPSGIVAGARRNSLFDYLLTIGASL